jgi:hypothetical protein
MDAEVAPLDARVRRLGVAIAVVAGASIVHLVLVIAILAQLRTPLPGWAGPLFVSLMIGPVAIVVLRIVRTAALVAAARARIDAAHRSIDALEAEQERVRRERDQGRN